MIEVRCGDCGRLLARASFSRIEIKCPRCKTLNSLRAIEPPTQAPASANVEVNHGQANTSMDGR
ncbi:Mu-like prophage protein Com [Methylophaga frappieri]|uniref:Mu-like prophage protein Com n=1 Tax=Methylophaga frappieri (strain ATCC BAA-2434 / DSM 25690 / JAM7) TaxID=754477 RepID=I1YGG9_METFJ|nr:Com family DNA-binding transcriptional regulator [Methylophaga frappieri]AFJ02012.1 Mu-like prophage protein Com [Methylophaga frappieri]